MHSSPFGPAGGALGGAYPNPTLKTDEASLVLAGRVYDNRAIGVLVGLFQGFVAWLAGVNRAAPNGTINVHWFKPNTGTANADVALVPLGTGSFLGAIPDNATLGGNKRGTRSVDLGLNRGGNTNVASGNNAVIVGGISDTASGGQSACIAGQSLQATNSNSGAFAGSSCQATGAQAVTLGGSSVVASGSDATACGNGTTASGNQSFASGLTTVANAVGASAMGALGTARGILGAFARGSSQTGGGHQQAIDLILRIDTTNATVTAVTVNNGAAAATNQYLLPSGSGLKVRAQWIARNQTTGDCAWGDVTGACKNVAGTVTLSGVPLVSATGGDAAMLACAVNIIADNANKCLQFTATGIAATNISWVIESTSAELNH